MFILFGCVIAAVALSSCGAYQSCPAYANSIYYKKGKPHAIVTKDFKYRKIR